MTDGASEARRRPKKKWAGAGRFPTDAVLMPLSSGGLLVSPQWAVFCPVPPEQVAAVEGVLAGAAVSSLSEGLVAELRRHGFFDRPRPEESAAPTVQIQLTNACNLSCHYCCTDSGPPRRGELDYNAMLEAARDARRLLGKGGRASLLGGEPFLVPWAVDLAEEMVRIGLDLTIFSNGTLFTQSSDLARRVAALVRQGAELRVSLAGPTKALCDGVSGAPRWDEVLAGIHHLARHGARAEVDLMVLSEQAEGIARHLPALRRALPPSTPLSLGLIYSGGRERGERTFRSRRELESALDRIAVVAGERVPAPQRSPVTYRRHGCGCASGNHISVRSDGALYRCFKMAEKVGHLQKGGLLETARSLRSLPIRACELPVCAGCPLATICGGGCRSDNLLYTGDADRPPCGPWRVQVLGELLAEDQVDAVKWLAPQLLAEAHARGIDAPEELPLAHGSSGEDHGGPPVHLHRRSEPTTGSRTLHTVRGP